MTTRTSLRVVLACLWLLGCGGEPAVSIDAAVTTDAVVVACASTRDCDDGLFCNGLETCVDGACAAGGVVCEDFIACTIDRCDEARRACAYEVPDLDLDGAGDARCLDGALVPLGTDCDDEDPDRFPGNTEDCDHHDEDCDETTLGGSDEDVDGYIPWDCCNPTEDGESCGLDCDDTRPELSPVSTEVCDGEDNDCDGAIDDGTILMSWPDVDHDGFGDATATPDPVCEVPSFRANQGGDCDDANRRAHPFQTEECNAVDDDCDGLVDEGGDRACGYGLTGTTTECLAGRCVVTGCAPGRFDCNGDSRDGCEPLCTASATCGTCDLPCTGAFTDCNDGRCIGLYLPLQPEGVLRDLETGALVPGATITVIDSCPVATATTAADGTWQLPNLAAPARWLRIEAPGYRTHVLQFASDLRLIPSARIDAWIADPDAAGTASETRAIFVVDYELPSPDFVRDRALGPSNAADGSDLLPVSSGMRDVFLEVVPGRLDVGGASFDGAGCSLGCGAERELWLEGGAVTFVTGMACTGVCS